MYFLFSFFFFLFITKYFSYNVVNCPKISLLLRKTIEEMQKLNMESNDEKEGERNRNSMSWAITIWLYLEEDNIEGH